MAGALISIVAFVLLAVAHGHEWEILLAMVLQGRRVRPGVRRHVEPDRRGVPPEQTGVASGMNANIRTIGGSIGAAVMSSIVTVDGAPRAGSRPSPATPTASRSCGRCGRSRRRPALLVPDGCAAS